MRNNILQSATLGDQPRLLIGLASLGACLSSVVLVFMGNLGAGHLFRMPVRVFIASIFAITAAIGLALPASPNSVAYARGFCTLGLAVALHRLYLMFASRAPWCGVCAVEFGAMALCFAASEAGQPTQSGAGFWHQARRDFARLLQRPVAAVGVLVFVGMGVAAAHRADGIRRSSATNACGAPDPSRHTVEAERRYVESFQAQPRAHLPIPCGGARVLVVAFVDYQCPACARALPEYLRVIGRRESHAPGVVRLVRKAFPLERECNPFVEGSLHRLACEAAPTVEMARAYSREEALSSWLFANQRGLDREGIWRAASTVGFVPNPDQLYPGALEQVKADLALAHVLGVRSTPTLFINGAKAVGISGDLFDLLLQEELLGSSAGCADQESS